jgi:hypothetical protein
MPRGEESAGANEPAQFRFFIFGSIVMFKGQLTDFEACGNDVRQAGKRS